MFHVAPAAPVDPSLTVSRTLRCPACGHTEHVTVAGRLPEPAELPAWCLSTCRVCAARLAPRMVVAG